MRFLMLNWRDPKNPFAGGAERVTLGYLAALAQRGHEVFWYSHDFPGGAKEELIDGIRIVRGGGVKNAVFRARRWYREQTPMDLVIDQHHGIPWYAPWWCKTNCIAYIHEVLGPIWNVFYRWPWNWIGRCQERWTHWLYRNIPFWTACESTKRALQAHGVKNITIIPYGVHTRALPQLPAKPLAEPLRLVVVSRLAPNKRIDHALLAFKILVDRGVNARLTIVGTGMSENGLRTLAARSGLDKVVRFLGSLPEADKDRQLEQAHFLLHTSQREGWGLNVIEANAMGTPAAVYPVPGLVESTVHGETGLVAAGEEPGALATVLQRIMAEPEKYQSFRRQAWERAKRFHWDNVLPEAWRWLEGQARLTKDHLATR